jgi:D-alanyl-D-alanine-carboxypeptidase/D-alanyl-D-alanine-endopeptidase
MPQSSFPNILSSLDETVGPGAESAVLTARKRKLLKGVAVGIVRDGQSFLRFYGEGVGPESLFELGSVTKTYTAELLTKLAERGSVRLEDPVALYVPGGLEGHDALRPVRLLDLATHHSGVPRLPPGMGGVSRNPYARYGKKKLEGYLRSSPLRLPIDTKFGYSNLGYSILGYALAEATGISYARLIESEILEPVGMKQTALALGQAQPGLLKGYTQIGIPTSHWTFDAFAPCGALCSTVGDQLKYLAWLLKDVGRISLRTSGPAPGGSVGLGWMIRNGGDDCWHNGGTFGFSSYISLNRSRRSGIVVLSQVCSPRLVTTLGRMFERSLSGETIEPLKGEYGRTKSWVLDPALLILSPLNPVAGALSRMPPLVRIPVVLGGGYGVDRLAHFISEHVKHIPTR